MVTINTLQCDEQRLFQDEQCIVSIQTITIPSHIDCRTIYNALCAAEHYVTGQRYSVCMFDDVVVSTFRTLCVREAS